MGENLVETQQSEWITIISGDDIYIGRLYVSRVQKTDRIG